MIPLKTTLLLLFSSFQILFCHENWQTAMLKKIYIYCKVFLGNVAQIKEKISPVKSLETSPSWAWALDPLGLAQCSAESGRCQDPNELVREQGNLDHCQQAARGEAGWVRWSAELPCCSASFLLVSGHTGTDRSLTERRSNLISVQHSHPNPPQGQSGLAGQGCWRRFRKATFNERAVGGRFLHIFVRFLCQRWSC